MLDAQCQQPYYQKNNASYYHSTDEKLNALAFYPAVSVAAVGYQDNYFNVLHTVCSSLH